MSDLNENSFFVRKDYSKRSLFKDQYNLVLKLKKENVKKPEGIKEELPIATQSSDILSTINTSKTDSVKGNKIKSYSKFFQPNKKCIDSQMDDYLSNKLKNKELKESVSNILSQEMESANLISEISDVQFSNNDITLVNRTIAQERENEINKKIYKNIHKLDEEKQNLYKKMNMLKENIKFLQMESEEEKNNKATNDQINKMKRQLEELSIKLQNINIKIDNLIKDNSDRKSKKEIMNEYITNFKSERKLMKKKMLKVAKENEELAMKRENLIKANEEKAREEHNKMLLLEQEEKNKEQMKKKVFHNNQVELVSKLHQMVQGKILSPDEANRMKRDQYYYLRNQNHYNICKENDIKNAIISRKKLMKSIDTEELNNFSEKIDQMQNDLEKKRKEKIKQLKNEWKERADSLPSNKVEKVFVGKGGWLKLGNPKPLSLLEENKKKFCEKIRYKFKPKTTKKNEDTNNNSISSKNDIIGTTFRLNTKPLKPLNILSHRTKHLTSSFETPESPMTDRSVKLGKNKEKCSSKVKKKPLSMFEKEESLLTSIQGQLKQINIYTDSV